MAPRLLQLLLVASAALAALCPVLAADVLCSADFPDVGVIFSAAEIGAADQSYTDKTGKHTYYINPCGAVKTAPPVCGESEGAVAFHLDESGTKASCKRIAAAETPTASLLDKTNPAAGVRLHFKNGDTCEGDDKTRSITVDLICSRANGGSSTSFISNDGCNYGITIKHPAACPSQCPYSCSGRGFCGYDTSLRGARCFCDVGATGNDCTETSSSAMRPDYEDASSRGGYEDLSSGHKLMVAMCVFLGLLCICAGGHYLYVYRIRAVKPTIDAIGAGASGTGLVLGDDDDPDSIVFSAQHRR